MKTRQARKKAKVDAKPAPKLAEIANFGPNHYQKDEMALLGIFPTEIWTMVLENVKDSPSQLNLSNSSLYFRSILLPKRIYFLFPSLWSVLRCRQSDYQNKVNPKSTEILKYRQVCTTWNNAVKNFYQHHPAHFSLKPDTNSSVINSNPIQDKFALTKFSTYVLTTDFRRRFDTAQNLSPEVHNPFIGRAITLDTTLLKTIHGSSLASALRDLRRIMFWLGLTPVLKKYGHHIWYCTIKGSAYNIVMMLRCLEDMPNLKCLNLQVTSPPKAITPERIAKLRAKMDGNTIPTLLHLKYLNAERIPAVIFNKLLSANSHISHLRIKDGREDYIIFQKDFTMFNLRKVAIEGDNVNVFQKLGNLEVKWNLQEFYFKLNGGSVRYFEIFKEIENWWGNKLEKLEVDLQKCQNLEDNLLLERSFNFRWNLQSLKHLELKLEYQPCLDFLLPLCNNLEYLQICGQLNYGKGKGSTRQERFITRNQLVKIIGFVFKMRESNIWNLFGKLEGLRLDCKSTNFMYRRPLNICK